VKPELPVKDRGTITIEDFAAGFAQAYKA